MSPSLSQTGEAKRRFTWPTGTPQIVALLLVLLVDSNQQKVLLSRWLLTKPQFLILDEPTRGIDVGAHAEIIRLIETLCADGLALLVISSELEELVGYADRVIIMRDRRQVAEIPLDKLSVPAIMNAIAA